MRYLNKLLSSNTCTGCMYVKVCGSKYKTDSCNIRSTYDEFLKRMQAYRNEFVMNNDEEESESDCNV